MGCHKWILQQLLCCIDCQLESSFHWSLFQQGINFSEISDAEHEGGCYSFGTFFVGLAAGLKDIELEHNSINYLMNYLPPYM